MLKLATKFACAAATHAFGNAYLAGFRYAQRFGPMPPSWPTGRRSRVLARHYPLEYVLHFPNHLDLRAETLEAVRSKSSIQAAWAAGPW